MTCALVSVLCLGLTAASPETPATYLCQPAQCVDNLVRGPLEPCQLQEGDLIFFQDDSVKWAVLFALAGTGPPYHVGVVVRVHDGRLFILEAGPNDTSHIQLMEPYSRLEAFCGKMWVRRRCVPLTCEESARLTEFAAKQQGKYYALIRLAGQLTPFRHRGPLRTFCVGKPNGPDRWGYWCSELVLEALLYAGLLDPAVIRPTATYPRDMFHDASPNPYINRTLDLSAGWEKPRRWVRGCDPHPSR